MRIEDYFVLWDLDSYLKFKICVKNYVLYPAKNCRKIVMFEYEKA